MTHETMFALRACVRACVMNVVMPGLILNANVHVLVYLRFFVKRSALTSVLARLLSCSARPGRIDANPCAQLDAQSLDALLFRLYALFSPQ